MRDTVFLVLTTVLLAARPSAADIAVAPPEGDVSGAFLDALRASLQDAVETAHPPAGRDAELRAAANAAEGGVSLEVALVPADGSPMISENRVASPASALAQARAMARSAIARFAAPSVSPPKEEPPEPSAPTTSGATEATGESNATDVGFRTAAQSGMIAGYVLQAAGILGVIGSTISVGAAEDASSGPFIGVYASGGVILLGSLWLDASYTARLAAYRRADLEPRPNLLVMSWVFTAGSIALYVSSVGTWAHHVEGSDDIGETIGGAVASVLTFEAAFLIEIVNSTVLRILFRRALRMSDDLPRPVVSFSPFVDRVGAGRGNPSFGLAVFAAF